jgi:hypothetical protein
VQPTHPSLRFSVGRGALAFLALLTLVALDARVAPGEPMRIGSPTFDWGLWSLLYDGQSGTTTEFVVAPPIQIGGAVDDRYEAQLFPDVIPDAEVFSEEGGRTFWIAATSAHTTPDPIEGDPIGGKADLNIYQSFEKDEADARLFYKLTAAKFVGLDPSPAIDDLRPYGFFYIVVTASYRPTPTAPPDMFFDFVDGAELTGKGREWDFSSPANFSLVPSVGSLNQSYVELSLAQPFTLEIDISSVPLHEEFTLHYEIFASAEDTAQVDTGISVYAKDPADPNSGSYFEYTGLTPTDRPLLAPEPGSPALVLSGVVVLLCFSGLRAGRGPQRSCSGGRVGS